MTTTWKYWVPVVKSSIYYANCLHEKCPACYWFLDWKSNTRVENDLSSHHFHSRHSKKAWLLSNHGDKRYMVYILSSWCWTLWVEGVPSEQMVYTLTEKPWCWNWQSPWEWLFQPIRAQVMALFARMWDMLLQDFVFCLLGSGLAFLSSSATAMFIPCHFMLKGCNLLFDSTGAHC